jgi:parvulin-like peptidyl-prolyl isomerase
MARPFLSGPPAFGLLAVALLASAGCDRGSTTAVTALPPPSGDVVPCFPEWGEVAFVVNGVPVPEATLARFAAFYKELGAPGDDKARARAIDETILPTAAVYAEYRDRGKLAEWSRRVREAESRLARGEDFAEVARSSSDCATKSAGGDLGSPFRRDQNIAPLTEAGFRIQVGEVSPPIVTIYGAHLLKVTGSIDGSSPGRDQRQASHVLIAFDPKDVGDLAAFRDLAQKLRKEARVDQVKEPYKKVVAAVTRR